MTSGTQKPALRRKLRVATTFTGAAACALTFAPAAMAGTHPAAARPGHQLQPFGLNLHGIRAIANGNCEGANQSHWLHLEASFGSVTCYGMRGKTGSLGAGYPVSSYCGGNNSGHLNYNGHTQARFQVGTYYYRPKTHPFLVNSVSISTWHGSDTCSGP
jgi:hypothetical protein